MFSVQAKTRKFIKNGCIAAAGAFAAAAGAAELTDLLTGSQALNPVVTTATEIGVGYPLFLWLHARDNQDLYRLDGRFQWRPYVADMVKLNLGLGVLDALYFIGRPFVDYYFQKRGLGSATASLVTDSSCLLAYIALAVPTAKTLGVLRTRKNS